MNTIVLVEAFNPLGNGRTRRSRTAILDLLNNHAKPFDRWSFDPGHITASAVVLSVDRTRLLLVYHRKLGRWLQPGGHVEPDDRNVTATARREVLEETGIKLEESGDPTLVGLDVHQIPAAGAEPLHLHHDLTFSFTAREEDIAEPSGSERAVWCEMNQLDRYGVDEPLHASLERALCPSHSSPPNPL